MMSPVITIPQSTMHRTSEAPSITPTSAESITPTNHQHRATTRGGHMIISPHSTLAGKAISEGNYKTAFECYQLALEDYLKGAKPSVVELVNAAATCFNLGALSKKLQDYQRAGEYFCQAEELYKRCADIVRQAPYVDTQQFKSRPSCEVCLFQLIVETIQARAHLHYKYQSWLEGAIECHEEVVELLEQKVQEDKQTVYCKIHFTALSQKDRWHLLITSLQSLGKFYVERGDFEDGLVAYQEALSLLRDQDSNSVSSKRRQEEITQIIRALTEIYFQTNSSTMQVPQLERLACAQEDLKNWDKAISCWEQILYLQSQDHGEVSTEVADTLCQIARVMVAQGNHEGALDLYHAAGTLYQKTNAEISREFISNVVDLFCQLRLYPAGLGWVENLLSEGQCSEQRAWIYCELGKLYLEQGNLRDASQALCQSAELLESDDDVVFKLIQKLEFLQQNDMCGLKMGLEAILEDDEVSSRTQLSSRTQKSKDERDRLASPSLLDSKSEEQTLDGEGLLEEGDDHDQFTPALEEHRLEGLVNESMNSVSMVDKSSDSTIRGQSISDMSSPEPTSLPKDKDEAPKPAAEAPTGPAGDDTNVLSPILRDRIRTAGMHFSPVVSTEISPSEPKKRINVVTPGSSPSSVTDGNDKSRTQQHDNASKSTEDTEHSLESTTPETSPVSPKGRDGARPSKSETRAQKKSTLSPSNSDDGSGTGSRFDRSESREDEEEINTDTSVSLSHVSNPKCLYSDEDDDDENSADALIKANPLNNRLSSCRPSPTHKASATSMLSAHSRTGLLQPEEKNFSSSQYRKAHPSPPKHPKLRDKRDYSAMPESSKVAQRNRFVKVLASPFRRSRTKKSAGTTQVLVAVDEEKEVKGNIPEDSCKRDADDEVSESAKDFPFSYVSADDDAQSQISQITFRVEEQSSKKRNNDSQWWWGVTAEGLEGWFPTSYVNQAVEAAEGFLSAKSIHERVKSRPLDFDSDEESDVEESEEKESSMQAKDSQNSNQTENPPSKQAHDKPSLARLTSLESSTGKPSNGSGSVGAVTGSSGSKRPTLLSQLEEKVAILDEQKAELGFEDVKVATTLFELAQLYSQTGDITKALDHGRQALKIQKSTMNLSDAAKSLHFMADLYSRGTQYKAALSCYNEAQRLEEVVFGYFHEETANTLNRIGNVLLRQGEFDLAMENHKEALRILKECFGEKVKHPLVTQTLIQIGAVYYKERNSLATIQANVDGYSTFIEGGMLEVIGRAHEERGSYRMAIAFFEEKLQFLNNNEKSKELEQVAETLNSLGMLSCRAGLYLEAIDYYDRALGLQMKLGCDNVQLAMAKVLAGSVQYYLGHFRKALKLFEEAIRTLREKVGHEHETVAATLYHKGVVRFALCEFDDAMSDLREALKIQKKLLGNEHPATLRTRREIGNLYAVYESELEAAFKEYNAVLDSQKQIHGLRHPNIAETLHSIGCAQAKQGDFTAALRTLEDCYNMRLEFLGMDHPLQGTTLHEIAKIQLKRGRVKKAIHICDSALTIKVESLSEHHVDVATSMATKASCFVARGNFADANKTFLEALSIAEMAVGQHPAVASIHVQMGIMHLRKCHFDEASEAITKGLEIYRKCSLDEDYPGIKEALQELERVERAEMLCV